MSMWVAEGCQFPPNLERSISSVIHFMSGPNRSMKRVAAGCMFSVTKGEYTTWKRRVRNNVVKTSTLMAKQTEVYPLSRTSTFLRLSKYSLDQ
jgi:hypothetical protein